MDTRRVISKDGTSIAFDQYGKGPPVILVGGAMQYRAGDPGTAQLAAILAQQFTVIHYDRRGRGDSGDTPPYAVEREVEDLEALIQPIGGSALMFGMSSGAALGMEAAIELRGQITKLAMYEPPYNSDPAARQAWKEYRRQLNEFLAAGRRGDAVALFMNLVGVPAGQIAEMRRQPMWPMLEAVAPTLAYDHNDLMGEDASVPAGRASSLDAPAMIIVGEASYPFMHATAMALATAIPNAQYRILEGQTHNVDPAALAPVLVEFFTGSDN